MSRPIGYRRTRQHGNPRMSRCCQEYDDLFGPILDGQCNKFGQPPAHFTLPFNVNYPHRCDSEPKRQFDWMSLANRLPSGPGLSAELKEFEETNRAIAQEYLRHFAERGWTRTRFEIFHNQKPSPNQNRIPWKLDEPIEENDYRALEYLFNTSRWAFAFAFEKPASNQVQVVTRLDIGHFHCEQMLTPEGKPTKDYKAKQFDSHNAPRYLKDVTDHWVIGIVHAEGAQHLLANYEGPGRKIMVYGTSGDTALDQHYGQFAGECVRWARMGIVGRVDYKVDLASGNPNRGRGIQKSSNAKLRTGGTELLRRAKIRTRKTNSTVSPFLRLVSFQWTSLVYLPIPGNALGFQLGYSQVDSSGNFTLSSNNHTKYRRLESS
jgi:hypothetical protein